MAEILFGVGVGLGGLAAVLAGLAFVRRDPKVARAVLGVVAAWGLVQAALFVAVAVELSGFPGGVASRATVLAGAISEGINAACWAPMPVIAWLVARRVLRSPG